jgi:hypothetical protein
MKHLVLVASVAALAAASLGVGNAKAGLFGCSYPTITQPFAAWSDWTNYYLSPGGSFEGFTAWGLGGGASIRPGNESFFVRSASDSYSLHLSGSAYGQSPFSCITGTDLKVRMFARSDTSAPLRVQVMVPSLLGLLRVVTSFTLPTTPNWQPTNAIVNLANLLSLTNLSQSNIAVRVVSSNGEPVDVDDVFIDPHWND